MAKTVNINFRIEEDLKSDMENVCNEMGISMTAAFTMFAKKVVRDKRIPFEIVADVSNKNTIPIEAIMAYINRNVPADNPGDY